MRRLGVLSLAAALGCAAAWSNPFITPSAGGTPAPASSAAAGPLVAAQRRLNDRLAGLVAATRAPGATGERALLLGVAFAYGLLHALGPGHRKAVLASYFVSEGARAGAGVLAGVLMSGLHAASAVGLVLGGHFVVRRSLSLLLTDASRVMECASYAAIVLMGAGMLGFKVAAMARESRGKPARGPAGNRGLLLLVIVSGMVPCPGAAMLLVFAISLDALPLGILAVVAMSVGMASALLVVSVSAILLRERVLALVRGNGMLASVFHHGLEMGGAAAMVAFGLFMLLPRL